MIRITDVGLCETQNSACRPTMEDRTVVAADFKSHGRRMPLFALFDGHGGSEVAAIAADSIIPVLSSHLSSQDPPGALSAAYAEIDKRTTAFPATGCTAVTVLMDASNGLIYVANAGDSRCIAGLACDGAVALSVDHKPTDPRERTRIAEAGGIVANARVAGLLATSRSFGDHMLKAFVPPTPDIVVHDFAKNRLDCLVLACDGLFDVVSNDVAIRIVRESVDAVSAAKKLVNTAMDNGTTDNVSVCVVRFEK